MRYQLIINISESEKNVTYKFLKEIGSYGYMDKLKSDQENYDQELIGQKKNAKPSSGSPKE